MSIFKADKICLLLLTLLMSVLLLVSCGEGGPDVDTTEAPAVTTEAPISEAPAELVLAADGKINYTVVRSDTAGDVSVKSTMLICTAIEELTGIIPDISTDWIPDGTTPNADTPEILVGATNHPESEKALEGVPYGDYVIAHVGNKIIINAWSEIGIQRAASDFIDLLQNSVADGRLILSPDFRSTGTIDSSINVVPTFAGATFSAVYDAGDDNTLLLLKNATPEGFTAYGDALVAAGFSLYTQNSLADNLFSTYYNDKYMINVGYYAYEKAVRLIFEPIGALPPLKSGDEIQKLVEPSCLLRGLGYNDPGTPGGGYTNGMCIIFQTSDGKYIIIDGGFSKTADAKGIYEYLYKHAPDKNNITIAAWIMTHAHGDHYGAWLQFSKYYARKVKLEYFIANFPSAAAYEALYQKGDGVLDYIDSYKETQIIKPHVGQAFHFGDARVEILFTLESYAPTALTHENTSSIIFSVELGGQKFMILGDATNVGCTIAANMFGNTLKSDFVQTTHHGVGVYGGDEPASGEGVKRLYSACASPVILWPASDRGYREAIARGYTYNTHLLGLASTKEIFIAGAREVRLVLPYTPGTSGLESLLK